MNMIKRLLAVIILLVLSSYHFELKAELVPLDNETRVSNILAEKVSSPFIATDSQSGFVIALSETINGKKSIVFNRYNQQGVKMLEYSTGSNSPALALSDIAMNSQGYTAATFLLDSKVFIQVFTPEGEGIFSQLIQISNGSSLSYYHSSIAINDSGVVSVSWNGYQPNPYKTFLYTRQFHIDGYWLTNEINFNQEASLTSSLGASDVGVQPNGDFIVAWNDYKKLRGYTKVFQMGGAVKKATKALEDTPEIRVQGSPKVAVNKSTGDYMVSWASLPNGYGPGNYWSVYTQKFNSSAVKQGSIIRNNQITSRTEPAINNVFNSVGLWVAWDSYNNNDYNVFASSFHSDGSLRTPETQLNSYYNKAQRFPALGVFAQNELLSAWFSQTQNDGKEGVYFRRHLDNHVE